MRQGRGLVCSRKGRVKSASGYASHGASVLTVSPAGRQKAMMGQQMGVTVCG